MAEVTVKPEIGGIYAYRKEKIKHFKRHASWEEFCFENVSCRFSLEDSELKHPEFLEPIVIGEGLSAIWKDEETGEYICTKATRTGSKLSPNGLLNDLKCITENGHSVTFHDFEDENSEDYNKVAIIRNNRYESPDEFFMQYADVLAEIDKSIMHIIKNTRSMPLAVCSDENAQKVVENAFKNSDDGEIRAVTIKNPFEESKPVDILPLNAVENSSLIQYLYKAKDDTLRQFYQHYGICGSGEAKMAQLTEAEVEKGNNSFLIETLENLKIRQKDVEIMNKKFGWNARYVLGECWRREDAHHEVVEEEVQENEEILQSGEPSGENSPESGSESAE